MKWAWALPFIQIHMINKRLLKDIKKLSFGYTIEPTKNYFMVREFLLPPGYNREEISILVLPPEDYPISPPGVGSSFAYIPKALLFHGYELQDLHPDMNYPGFGDWAWLCFQEIKWNPNKDNLITFFEIVRTTLTNPEIIRPIVSPKGFFERIKRAFFE